MLFSGVIHRSSSSTACGIRPGSAASHSHRSGRSLNRISERASVVRVVSAPPGITSPSSELIVGQRHRHPADRPVRPPRHQVLGRARAARVDRGGGQGADLVDGTDRVRQLVRVRSDGVDAHQAFRPARHLPPVRVGPPDQAAGERRREAGRDRVDDIELADQFDHGQRTGHDAADVVLEGRDRSGGEAVGDQATLLGVRRVVLADHRRLGRRPDRPVAPARR